MMIINADDWGRTRAETDAASLCHRRGRITSASAMVFMPDSERAAELAWATGIDVGLHLNLTEPFHGPLGDALLVRCHARVREYLTARKYAFLVYNPALGREFQYVFEAQLREFVRLYGSQPSHIDGHHHQHLCTNILLGAVIPPGQALRRAFYFWPGEKSLANRAVRGLMNRLLTRRYRSTDYFFALSQCTKGTRMRRVTELAQSHSVELMTHPANDAERNLLLSDAYMRHIACLDRGTYASL
jgi:chitin disaccharide deacetylase